MKTKKARQKPQKPPEVESGHRKATYDSIAQAAAAERIPVSVLRFAKKHGCPAFDHGRVAILKFNEWFFNRDGTGQNWDESYKEWRAKRERQKYQLEEGKLIKADDAVSAGAEMWGALLKIFGQKFPSELPSRLRGLDELAMRRLLSESFQQGLDECRRVMVARIDRARKQDENEALAT